MKILCATDFSETSINAIQWVYDMLNDINGGELYILNCVEIVRRADMFVSIDDLLQEKAINDMKALEKKYMNAQDTIRVHTSVHKANTKTFISQYANKNNIDLIVTGTTGLTSLKDIVKGSVTDYLVKQADKPLLTIPNNTTYSGLHNIVMGIGTEQLSSTKNLNTLYNIIELHQSRIFLTQVQEPGKHTMSIDLRIEEGLQDLTYEYQVIEKDMSITNTLNNFCNQVDADMLCMIHYRKHWLQRLTHKSITKEELFDIQRPLLIIPD